MSASDDMVCRLYVNKRQMSYSGPMARNRLARLDEYVASPGYLSTLGWKDNGLRGQDFGGWGGGWISEGEVWIVFVGSLKTLILAPTGRPQ